MLMIVARSSLRVEFTFAVHISGSVVFACAFPCSWYQHFVHISDGFALAWVHVYQRWFRFGRCLRDCAGISCTSAMGSLWFDICNVACTVLSFMYITHAQFCRSCISAMDSLWQVAAF